MQIKQFLNEKAMPAFARMATQRHLLAIRNGIVQILPYVIIGSIAMIIYYFPIGKGGDDALSTKMPTIVASWLYWLYKWNFALLGLVSGISIGSELAKSYRLNQTIGGALGGMSLFMWIIPTKIADHGWMTAVGGTLDSSSMLGAILGSIIAIEIYRIVVKYNITIKLPKEVPAQVSQAFIAIVPVIIVTILFSLIRVLLGFDLRAFMNITLQPIGSFVTGNMGGAIIVNLLVSIIWWFGINLTGMIYGMMRPFWLQGLAENQKIKADKTGGEYKVFLEQFNDSFSQGGGAGATLGMLAAIFIFARSKTNKSIAYISIVPGIFNINEPLIFGYPIMLNPYFLVPFILSPLLITVIVGLLAPLFKIHIVAAAPWTLPTPIYALLATGMMWQGVVLAFISIAISFGVYTPFVIIYDRITRKNEIEADAKKEEKVNEKLAKVKRV